jgi:formyl-CoA transferase
MTALMASDARPLGEFGTLAGIVVLAVVDGVAGTFGAAQLADHGARVILVEPRGGSRLREVGVSPGLLLESIELDLGDRADAALFAELAASSDVLIEDLGVGVLEARGLTQERLELLAPALIVIRISPYGQTGPLSGVPGDDRTAQAFTGSAYNTGFPEGTPQPHRMPFAGYWCGISVANAALLGLLERLRSGRGQVVDLALYETILRCQEELIVQADQLGELKERMANEYAESAPSNVFPASDGGWVFAAAANDANFRRICTAMGRPDILADERFKDPPTRVRNRVEVNRVIAEWTRQHTTQELLDMLREVGAPVASIRPFREVVADEQIRVRENFVEVTGADGQPVLVSNVVPRMSATPGRLRGRAPMLDEHGDAIRASLGAARAAGSGATDPARVRDATSPPLRGIRVLDLGRFVAAQVTGAMLAEFGADVIKIELPGTKAATRNRLPRKDGVSLSNVMYQRGKRAITLDIRKEAGRAILLDLVRTSDMFIENFRPGTLERYSLGSEDLWAANPDLVIVRLSGFGQFGPQAQLPAFDPVAIATAGGMSIIGGAQGTTPLRPGPLLADYSATLMTFFGALAGLFARESGAARGQVIDLGLYEPLARMLGDIPARYARGEVLDERTDAPWSGAPDWRVGATVDDGWLLFSQWPPTAEQANLLFGTGDPSPEGLEARFREWLKARTSEDAVQRLREAGIVCAPIMHGPSILAEPHFWARDNLVTRDHYQLGPIRQQGVVPRLSRTPGHLMTSEAPWGMHTEKVLLQATALDEAALRELRAAAVI